MKIELTQRTAKDLDTLERAQSKLCSRVIAKIQSLRDNPQLGKPSVGPLKGKWSVSIGDYRVIYEVHNGVVVVLTVNHRKEVYRK